MYSVKALFILIFALHILPADAKGQMKGKFRKDATGKILSNAPTEGKYSPSISAKGREMGVNQNDSATQTHGIEDIDYLKKYGRHEISVSIGRNSTDEELNGNKSAGIATNGYYRENGTGTIAAIYKYCIRNIAVGFTLAFEKDAGLYYHIVWSNSRNAHENLAGHYTRAVYTIAPEFRYNYSESEQTVTTYGAVGIGISYQDEIATYSDKYYTANQSWLGSRDVDNSRFHANFNITLIGVRCARKFGFFGELGYGYKGIVNGGVLMKF